MKAKGIIFDMDGCLYPFDKGTAATFGESELSRQIERNVRTFFMERFGIDGDAAEAMYQDVNERFMGEVSLGLEKEHGVPRGEYFAMTWDLDPGAFMNRDGQLAVALGDISIKRALLSAAPMIWVDRVTNFLGIRQLFGPYLFSGDPDIRKPNPLAFLQVSKALGISPEAIVSVGDQLHTDIIPAKHAGMMTMLIGTDTIGSADFTAPNILSAIRLLQEEGVI